MVVKMASSRFPTVAPTEAVKRFLYDVAETANKTYPIWEKRLSAFLDEIEMDYEDKRMILEVQPIRHYYFASVVGIEAAKIRTLYSDEVAEELLADVNEFVDSLGGRTDHMISDLVFDIIQRVKISDTDDTKKSHDIALDRINDLLRLSSMESTKEMTKDIVFRQKMAQPIAVSVRHWWKGFKSCRQLAQTVPATSVAGQPETEPMSTAAAF